MSFRRGIRRPAPIATEALGAKKKKIENEVITYKSGLVAVPQGKTESILGTSQVDGLECVWSGAIPLCQTIITVVQMSWKFNWEQLETDGIDRITGHIKVRSSSFPSAEFSVDTVKDGTIEENIAYRGQKIGAKFSFEYTLTLHRSPIEVVCYDEMFQPSGKNDTILVIEEKKLHVNKAFLSYHSDFFSALFSSNFKEGQMDEIPIKDIFYDDFGLLMSVIYPKTQFPNDKTAKKLLELADRFLIPSVTEHVEYHLLHNTEIENGQLILMADKYDMPKLFEKCIQRIDSIKSARLLERSPEYEQLSEDAKAAISDRLNKFI